MYKYRETKQALKDWGKLKSVSPAVKKKFKDLILDILNNPRNLDSIGNPEQLRYTEVEMWSRELTKKDRIVYGIEPGIDYNMPEESEIIVFYQYIGHYSDK